MNIDLPENHGVHFSMLKTTYPESVKKYICTVIAPGHPVRSWVGNGFTRDEAYEKMLVERKLNP